MGNKKIQVWLPLLFAVVMTLGMWLGYQLRANTSVTPSFFRNTGGNTLDEILNLIKSRYVDVVNTDTLKEDAIGKMLSRLDPHTLYIPASALQEVNEDLNGNFKGIGIEFQVFTDTVNVVNVIQDGPSFKAGVQIGDKLLKVNDTASLTGKKVIADDVKKLLRGPGGSQVKVTVLRGTQLKNIMIERGIIPLPSVDAAYIISPQTGFIHINKFSQTTFNEFMTALERLQKNGMTQLILDLRGNGGGVLQQAADIVDQFLEGDKMIVYTKGTKVDPIQYHCKTDGLFEKGKLVVLTDEGSASASEIVAGALQDWDRAKIIGRRTFGKGLVQQQFQLTDGGALRLTVARYYTPLGRNIQKSYTNGKDAYEEELTDRYNDGQLFHEDTSLHKGPPFKTPGGHTVYGGGGITPDIFVSFDTVVSQKEVLKLYSHGTLSNFVYNYYVQNKEFFTGIKSTAELKTKFIPGEKEWLALQVFANKDSVDLGKIHDVSKKDLLQRIQSLMARQLWRTEGFYEVNNLKDPVVEKALAVMEQKN